MTVFRCLATFFQLCLLHFARYGRTELQDWSLHGPVVTTHYGFVRGYYLSNASVFLGIPYATPPVGPRKFQVPVSCCFIQPMPRFSVLYAVETERS